MMSSLLDLVWSLNLMFYVLILYEIDLSSL